MRLVANLFMCVNDLITPFYPPRRGFEARVVKFKCQGRSRKQFSPLWCPVSLVQSCLCAGKT